jgi:hypothetical protein
MTDLVSWVRAGLVFSPLARLVIGGQAAAKTSSLGVEVLAPAPPSPLPGGPGALEVDPSAFLQSLLFLFGQIASDFAGLGHLVLLAFSVIQRYQS